MAVAALALVVLPSQVEAQNEGITQTKHNFSGSRDGTFQTLTAQVADYGEVCVYCHTPHGGSESGPLWNRGTPAGPFQLYDASAGAADLNMTFAAGPGPVSLACLSCHDGTIGIDVITNAPNASTATSIGADMTTIAGLAGTSAFIDLGTDLRNDHPIAVTYDPALDPQFHPVEDLTTAGLKLYSGQVECATCHNPHTLNATFLRVDNAASNLCLTCHIK
jgi:predicted CXXCH cytochrome family protein